MADFVYPARNLPGLAEDWGRAVEARDKILDRDFTQLSQSVNNGQRATGGQLAVISEQIDRLTQVVNLIPITTTSSESASGFGLTGSYTTTLTMSVPVPLSSNQVNLAAFGYMHVLDTLSGGLTSSRLRIGIGGVYSPDFWAAKDSGATQVLNVLNGTHSRTLSVTPGGSIPVILQAYGLNPSAFPSGPTNFASLTVIATFNQT